MRASVLLLCLLVLPASADGLSLGKAFPRGPAFGPSARSYGFSGDGKWACWLHRGWKARRHGRDLYVLRLDEPGAAPQRVTSPAVMAAHSAKARAVLADWRARNRAGGKQLTDEQASALPEGDLAARDKPVYAGIRVAAWSPVGAELLFVAGNDLFRWRPGGKPRRIADDGARQLWWQADGKGVIYRSRRSLYRLRWTGDGEPVRARVALTFSIIPRFGTWPSPDGNWVAQLRLTGGWPSTSGIDVLELGGRTPSVRGTRRRVPGDAAGSGKLELSLVRVADGKAVTIFNQPYTGFYDRIQVGWRADGRQLGLVAFAQGMAERGRITIGVSDVPTDRLPKIARTLLQYPHEGSAFVHDLLTLHWAGTSLVVLDERSGWRCAMAIDPAKGETRLLTPPGGEAYCFGADEGGVYVQSTHRKPAALALARTDVASGKIAFVTPPIAAFVEPVASPGGAYFLAKRQRYGWLDELVLVDGKSGSTRALTKSHPPTARAIVAHPPRVISLKNRKGDALSATLFTPHGWKPTDRRPAIVFVYGGPVGTRKIVQHGNVGPIDYLAPRVLADGLGCVCIGVDVRGSSGYGIAFQQVAYRRPGEPQTEDLEDVVRALGAYGVNTKRVALFGWSYGAHVVCRALLTRPRTFAGGVACATVTDWRSYYAEYVRAAVDNKGPEALARYALPPLAGNLKRPLLLVHGARDRVVLFNDSLALYRALLEQRRGHLVELFFDPTGGHRLGGTVSMKEMVRKIGTFYSNALR